MTALQMVMSQSALSRIHLLIFDLDGTLIDSQKDLALSVNAMRAQMGREPLRQDLIAAYVGRGVTVLVRRALGDQATDEEVDRGVAVFLEYYRSHMLDNTDTYPGVRDGLEALQGRKLAVLTNKPYRFSCEILAGLGIDRYFSFVYGGNSFPQKKPDPIGVTTLMNKTRFSPAETLVVGDSDTDVLAGRAAGAWTCGVTYGFGAQTLESAPPDLLVSDLRDLPLLLNGRTSGSSAI